GGGDRVLGNRARAAQSPVGKKARTGRWRRNPSHAERTRPSGPIEFPGRPWLAFRQSFAQGQHAPAGRRNRADPTDENVFRGAHSSDSWFPPPQNDGGVGA